MGQLLRSMSDSALKRLRSSIKRRNEAFEKLSPTKKNVAVAKDVLKQLAAKRIVAAHTYFRLGEGGGVRKNLEGLDLGEVIERLPPCAVCAVGSIFVSVIRLRDQAKIVSEPEEDGDIRKSRYGNSTYGVDVSVYGHIQKTGIFDNQELSAMEDTFECRTGAISGGIFHEGVDDEIVLQHIMKNIIRNNGRFVGEDSVMQRAASRLNRKARGW